MTEDQVERVVNELVMAAMCRQAATRLDASDLAFATRRLDKAKVAARAAIAAVGDEWRTIESAPLNTPVRIKLGEGMEIVARLIPDASMNSDEQSCDQWRAEHEGEHPECWHDGCCWESNADEQTSLQPTHWRPLPKAPDVTENTK